MQSREDEQQRKIPNNNNSTGTHNMNIDIRWEIRYRSMCDSQWRASEAKHTFEEGNPKDLRISSRSTLLIVVDDIFFSFFTGGHYIQRIVNETVDIYEDRRTEYIRPIQTALASFTLSLSLSHISFEVFYGVFFLFLHSYLRTIVRAQCIVYSEVWSKFTWNCRRKSHANRASDINRVVAVIVLELHLYKQMKCCWRLWYFLGIFSAS